MRVSIVGAILSFGWLQTLLFTAAPTFAASRLPRNSDLRQTLEQCAKSTIPAEKVDLCSRVISGTSDRHMLERAFNRRGHAYMDLQRFSEAAEDFSEVIKRNPRIAGYFDNRQHALRAMARFDEALRDANKAVQLAPTYAFVYRARAELHADMGRYDYGISDYTKAISIEPKDGGLLVDRGKLYMRTGETNKAISDFTQAIDIDPNMTAVALRERGFAYRLRGNFDAARADLTLFLRQQPDDEEAASVLRDLGPQPEHGISSPRHEALPSPTLSGSTLGLQETQRAPVTVVASTTGAERRVALIIGNSAYRNVAPLSNPANDARLMAETLRGLGFELVGGGAQIDLDKMNFEATVKRFGTALQGAGVGLFYYAGHGVQVRGENYLVPVSANPEREADVDFEMLGTSLVMRQMEAAGTRLNLVLLDACRNNPFGGRSLRSASRGLAQMTAPEGTFISFATQPGNVASDGEDGDSPYTKALAQTMKRPGLGIFEVFNEVGLEVKKQTGGSQQPWLSASPITGSFYFAGQADTVQPAIPTWAPAPIPQPNEAQQVWGTIQNTTSIAVLERYIQQFPASFYADIAHARLEELRKSQVPAASVPSPAPHGTGTMPCAELNRPHNPDPVRQWLRSYLASAGYDGDYQAAAAGIGALCQKSPLWTLEISARRWVEDLGATRNGNEAAASPRECSGRVGYVTGLDPNGDNNLSVRDGPHTPKGFGHEIDELFTGDSVCITGSNGTWLRVQYTRSGNAKSGWVHSRYIRLAGGGLK